MRTGPTAWVAALILFGALGAGLAQEVRVGDSADAVRKALGEPRGSIKSGPYEQLLYERGWVELRNGVVANTRLMTPEEAATHAADREQRLAAQRAADAERRTRWQAEGVAERDRMLADPAFMDSPASEQLRFWEAFRAQHPDVALDAEYLAALSQRGKDQEVQQLRAKVAEMERRLAEAEARVDRAVQEAHDAESRSRRYVYYDISPWPFYPRYVAPRVFPPRGNPDGPRDTNVNSSPRRPAQPPDGARDDTGRTTGPGGLRFSF